MWCTRAISETMYNGQEIIGSEVDDVANDGLCELESPPSPVSLNGFALVRSDLGEFTEAPEFNFPCEVRLVHNTGSRPWCVISGTDGEPWESVVGAIAEDYRVHMLQVGVANSGLDKEGVDRAINLVKSDLQSFERLLGEVSVYFAGNDVTVISHQHLDSYWAGNVMATIQERLEEARHQLSQ